jgi:hypothetical protein
LQREVQHRGLLAAGGSFSADLLGWLEVGADDLLGGDQVG